jgi:hypothetical protein
MESKQGDMMKFARYPNSYYYGIQPTISSVAADMDDMSLAYPTQMMYDAMVDRAYDEVMRMYPEEMQPQAMSSSVHTDQPFDHFRRRPIFRDLIAILLLQELLRRRRRY